MTAITALIARWNSPEGHPYKGKLIDIAAYDADPDNIGCMCAQGQALHLIGGYEPRALAKMQQADADKTTAELLGISRVHAVLLRNTNDSIDGAPAIVLTNPELVIGDQAPTILAFWRHLDRMTKEQWVAARVAAWVAAWVAARDAACDAACDAAWVAARVATAEIMGASQMRAKGQAFYFLPMFGFADPEAVLAAEAAQ